MRADQLLVERGLAASRSQAVRLIAGGLRWSLGSEWKTVTKNRDDIPEHAELQLLDDAEARYVSRGGLKLEGALRALKVDVAGMVCLDVGQSTGGFTDCLLQHGAARVVGVDVGTGQLHARLRDDERVCCVESVNARNLVATDLVAAFPDQFAADSQFSPIFSLVVGDVSFISLTLVLPALVPFIAPGADVVMLVKPQFELQPEHIGKGGMVKDEASYPKVEARVRAAFAELQLEVIGWIDSPIQGGEGSREFFIHARSKA